MGTSNLYDTKRVRLIFSPTKREKPTDKKMLLRRMGRVPKGQGDPSVLRSKSAISHPPVPPPSPKMVSITSDPSNARVYVDDSLIGKTPVEIPVTDGDIVHVRVSRKGYKSEHLEVTVESEKINVKLSRY